VPVVASGRAWSHPPGRDGGVVARDEEEVLAEVHGTFDDRFAGVRDALATQLDA